MTRLRLLTVLATAALLTGCAASPKPAPVMSASPTAEQVEAIRAAFHASHPNARVGVVTAVLSNSPYALVGQIDASGVTMGTVITFLDADQTVITNGVVQRADAGGLTVKFDKGMRPLRVGDAAVKF